MSLTFELLHLSPHYVGQMAEFLMSCAGKQVTLHTSLKPLTKKVMFLLPFIHMMDLNTNNANTLHPIANVHCSSCASNISQVQHPVKFPPPLQTETLQFTIRSNALSKHIGAHQLCPLPFHFFPLILYTVISVPGRAIYHTNVLLAIGQRWVVFCQVFPILCFIYDPQLFFLFFSSQDACKEQEELSELLKEGGRLIVQILWPQAILAYIYFAETYILKRAFVEYGHYLIVVMVLMLIF